ncbi:MAG TPA: virulence factor [Casimicrobiaceae bacterium]|nr:virulence factor [Casimicrobiaceae bacterium]
MLRRTKIAATLAATLLAGGLALAPSAQASRVAFDVSIAGPGYGISYSDGPRYYAPYRGYYAPGYVYSAPPVVYPAPYYYGPRVVYSAPYYYGPRYVVRYHPHYHHGHW